MGFQFHTCSKDAQPPEKLAALFQRVRTELGLEIHITEMDSSVSVSPTDEELELQARVYARTLRLALEEPNCKALVMWGLTDKHTWVPEFTNGKFGKPLLFDEEYHPKPAYYAMCNELRERKCKNVAI